MHHGHHHILLAAAVDQVAVDLVDGLHIRLIQVDHHEVRQLAGREDVGVRNSHDFCGIAGDHLQNFTGGNRSGAAGPELRHTGRQEHFAEDIQAVVAGRSVCADGDRDAGAQIILNRRNSAGQFHIGAGIGHDRNPVFFQDFDVFGCRVHQMITGSAVAEHTLFGKKSDRCHPVAADALIDLRLSLRNMGEDRLPVPLSDIRDPLDKVLRAGILGVEADPEAGQLAFSVERFVPVLHQLGRLRKIIGRTHLNDAHAHLVESLCDRLGLHIHLHD